MSDLVERVARAMYPSWWETIDTCTDGNNCESCPLDRAHSLGKARAAIAAVAEWLSEDPKAEQCCRDTISGALAAELKRIQK